MILTIKCLVLEHIETFGNEPLAYFVIVTYL